MLRSVDVVAVGIRNTDNHGVVQTESDLIQYIVWITIRSEINGDKCSMYTVQRLGFRKHVQNS